MNWSDIRSLVTSLEPRGLVLAFLMMGFWLIATNKASGGRMWPSPQDSSRGPGQYAWPLGLGALAFLPSIVYLQVPLQAMASGWVMANLATANSLLLGIPPVALSGMVQETAKLAVTLTALRLMGENTLPFERMRAGFLAGAGYGGVEAWLLLSQTVTFPGVSHGLLLIAIFERFVTIAFHLSLTGILMHHWGKGTARRILALVAVSAYHGTINYSILLLGVGALGIALFYALISAATLVTLVYGIAMIRRGSACHPEPD